MLGAQHAAATVAQQPATENPMEYGRIAVLDHRGRTDLHVAEGQRPGEGTGQPLRRAQVGGAQDELDDVPPPGSAVHARLPKGVRRAWSADWGRSQRSLRTGGITFLERIG